MSAKWTPEPWHIENLWHVLSEDGRLIAGCGGHDSNIPGDNTFQDNQTNARRIVACVNACAGIPTEALEAGVVGEMQRSLKRIADMKDGEGSLQAEYTLVRIAKVESP